MRLPQLLIAVLLIAGPAMAAPAPKPLGVAVFDLELHDTSLEGEMRGRDPAEIARLASLTTLLREAVAARPDMEAVDVAPLRDRLAGLPALHTCSGCEARFARTLGAERAVSGYVYKVSTLVLYIVVTVRDADDGQLLEKASVSIRGNTDESWRHGMQTLLDRYLFKEQAHR